MNDKEKDDGRAFHQSNEDLVNMDIDVRTGVHKMPDNPHDSVLYVRSTYINDTVWSTFYIKGHEINVERSLFSLVNDHAQFKNLFIETFYDIFLTATPQEREKIATKLLALYQDAKRNGQC